MVALKTLESMEPEDLSIHCSQLILDLLLRIIQLFVSNSFRLFKLGSFLLSSKNLSPICIARIPE